MIGSEAVARIARGVAFRTNVDGLALQYLQEAQRYYEMGKTLPWFLVVEDAEVVLIPGQASYPLPPDFIRQYEDEPLRYAPTVIPGTIEPPAEVVPTRVLRKGFPDAIEAYGDARNASPKVYVLRSNSLYFFPTPSQVDTLKWSYYAKADVIAMSAENVWLKNAPELLIGEAGLRLASDLRDADGAKRFTAMRDESFLALFKEIIAREIEDRRLVRGSDQ